MSIQRERERGEEPSQSTETTQTPTAGAPEGAEAASAPEGAGDEDNESVCPRETVEDDELSLTDDNEVEMKDVVTEPIDTGLRRSRRQRRGVVRFEDEFRTLGNLASLEPTNESPYVKNTS